MMKWFDRWFYKKSKEVLENKNLYDNAKYPSPYPPGGERPILNTSGSVINWNQSLSINVKRVHGGFIVNFHRNDNQGPDVPREHIYIITDEMDFDSELCKLITMERMR